MLGRALSPHLGDMVSPRWGLEFPMTGDARKGVEADGQHKTRVLNDTKAETLLIVETETLNLSERSEWRLKTHSSGRDGD